MLSSRRFLILLILSIISLSPLYSKDIYPYLDALGYATDGLLSRGKLDEKHEKMFQEVAVSLNISDRNIKARNSGILLRLLAGYNNAMAMQPTNRVYLNGDYLRELDDQEAKFIMAHELSHHRNHDSFKLMATRLLLNQIQAGVIEQATKAGFIDKKTDNFLAQYFTYGIGISLYKVSLWDMILAQIQQQCETRADTHAITLAGASPEASISIQQKMRYPQPTNNWPIYAHCQAIWSKLLFPLLYLPIIREHISHPSYKNRVANIEKLKSTK